MIDWLTEFGKMPATYVADGHHRTAAAYNVGKMRRDKAIADGIKLPGVTIDENGIKAPGVAIDDEGISAPGVKIDKDGISAPGVRIEAGEAGWRERVRIRESRRPGRYDDEFFAADGTLRRDEFVGMDLRGYDFSGYHLERVEFIDTDL